MHYRLILALSAMFIMLMIFTTVQQIISFINTQNNPVSSIQVIDNEDGHHQSSVILFGAFRIGPDASSRTDLAFFSYNVSENCTCRRDKTSRMGEPPVNNTCTHVPVNFGDSSLHSETAIIIAEAPVHWRRQERISFHCDHSADDIVVFTFINVAQPFADFLRMLREMGKRRADEFIDRSFTEFPTPWIHVNFITSVLLSRTEHYRQHRPERTQIDAFTSTTENVQRGQTAVSFAWREGFTTRIDKFTDRTVWSFAMLLCATLLGLERCLAFINRARAQSHKARLKHHERRKSKAAAAAHPSLDPVSRPFDHTRYDAVYHNPNMNGDDSLV